MPTDNQAQQLALAYAERAEKNANERWQKIVDELKEEIAWLKEAQRTLLHSLLKGDR